MWFWFSLKDSHLFEILILSVELKEVPASEIFLRKAGQVMGAGFGPPGGRSVGEEQT